MDKQYRKIFHQKLYWQQKDFNKIRARKRAKERTSDIYSSNFRTGEANVHKVTQQNGILGQIIRYTINSVLTHWILYKVQKFSVLIPLTMSKLVHRTMCLLHYTNQWYLPSSLMCVKVLRQVDKLPATLPGITQWQYRQSQIKFVLHSHHSKVYSPVKVSRRLISGFTMILMKPLALENI